MVKRSVLSDYTKICFTFWTLVRDERSRDAVRVQTKCCLILGQLKLLLQVLGAGNTYLKIFKWLNDDLFRKVWGYFY